MPASSDPIPASSAPPAAAARAPGEALPATARMSLFKAHMELGKVRLSAMVVFTTALGFVVGKRQLFPPTFDGSTWQKLAFTCLGTFLAAVGASAFNQAIETRRDAAMLRTRNRPLPARILSRTYAATFGLIVCIGGVALLCPTSNGLTACLAAANILIYALLYTPMKPFSPLNTLVGAIVGGIPPMLGWTAATNALDPGAWVLGGILFAWQIPHFLALAWMYRDDYARGGFVMLPRTDPSGRMTSMMALLYSLFLIPLCLMLLRLGHAGLPFGIISLILTAGLSACALRFLQTKANKDARRLFFASLIYLPILTTTLMIDARGPYTAFEATRGGYVLPTAEPFIDPASGATTAPDQ